MLNRAAILLRYKEPAVQWINKADPSLSDNPITLAEANEERTVYLISDEDADTAQKVGHWIKRNYVALMENELECWYTKPELWPKITWELFEKWFTVECHTVIVDTVGTVTYDLAANDQMERDRGE